LGVDVEVGVRFGIIEDKTGAKAKGKSRSLRDDNQRSKRIKAKARQQQIPFEDDNQKGKRRGES
jgi:hypothetical protein